MRARQRFLSTAILLLLLSTAFAGCLDENGDDDEQDTPRTIERPEWEPGLNWLYTFTTPEFDEMASRLVVAGNDGTNYQVGVVSQTDAQRHAVLNFNPILGRVSMEEFGIYENGIPQTILSFPLEKDKSWSFDLLDVEDFDAVVTDITNADLAGGGETVLVTVEARAPGGHTLDYIYDTEAGWLRSFVHRNAAGEVQLEMTLVSSAEDYQGRVYFIRASDLYDGSYASSAGDPVFQVNDTFVNAGHPSGDFDDLIYYGEVETQDGGGNVHLRDYTGDSHYSETYSSDTTKSTMGTVRSSSGDWTVQISLEGSATLRFRIAGGINYFWDV